MDEPPPSSHPQLLRRFLPQAGSTVVPATAFRPTANDTTGISVSFEHFPHPIRRILANTKRPPADYSVCRFNLDGLPQLSVVPSPELPHDVGHATIPEIAPPYDELSKTDPRKIQLKDWQAELALRSRVIHQPGDPII